MSINLLKHTVFILGIIFASENSLEKAVATHSSTLAWKIPGTGMENSAVATGLEKVSFHSNPKDRQCQRMLKLPHNCTHLTR